MLAVSLRTCISVRPSFHLPIFYWHLSCSHAHILVSCSITRSYISVSDTIETLWRLKRKIFVSTKPKMIFCGSEASPGCHAICTCAEQVERVHCAQKRWLSINRYFGSLPSETCLFSCWSCWTLQRLYISFLRQRQYMPLPQRINGERTCFSLGQFV